MHVRPRPSWKCTHHRDPYRGRTRRYICGNLEIGKRGVGGSVPVQSPGADPGQKNEFVSMRRS